MGLFERFTNPAWHRVSALDSDHQLIAALMITGYGMLRQTLKENLFEPLEKSGLVSQGSLNPDVRERLIDEAAIGLMKSLQIPESDPNGKLPRRVISSLPQVWGTFALADKSNRLKHPEPDLLKDTRYSEDADEARTQVLVEWSNILHSAQPNFVMEANKRWFFKAWTELSDAYMGGTLLAFGRVPKEVLLKKARSVSEEIPAHRIPKTISLIEIMAKAPLSSAHDKIAHVKPQADISRSPRDVSVLADPCDAEVQWLRGYAYFVGKGVPQDYAQAALWYRKAAEQGHAVAQFCLARLFDQGQGVPQDGAKAALWYRKAAEQGDAKAQFNLGVMYDTGRGVPRDYARAVSWYRKAAEQGDGDAQYGLGKESYLGRGVLKDYAEAALWFRKAAEQGHADAQFSLGGLYLFGYGVAQDYAEAVMWFRKAADQGLSMAQGAVGFAYYSGQGISQDRARAAIWYRKAAEQGDSKAQLKLAELYECGQGVPQSYAETYFWLAVAGTDAKSVAQRLSSSQLFAMRKKVDQWIAAHSQRK